MSVTSRLNSRSPDETTDVICRCSGTTTVQIERCLARGLRGLEEISAATGAVSGCGGCESEILALLAELQTDAH